MTQWLSGVHIDSVGVDGGSFTGGPRKILLHSTETKSRPSSFGGGSSYPHFCVTWNGSSLDIVQYIPLDRAARALVNAPGGVQTNRDGVIQIELTGTCNPAAPKDGRLFLPEAPDEYLKQLGEFIRRLAAVVDCSLDVIEEWAPLNDRGYATKSVRMSMSEWDNFGGICGHEHCPENDHVDPGKLDVARALQLSAGSSDPKSPVPPVVFRKPKPAPVPTSKKAPAFPLPRGDWFGPVDVNEPHNHSGYFSSVDRAKLRVWQSQMRERGWRNSKGQPMVVDGLFGPETERICKLFQTEKHLSVDGLVGPKTWAAAWTAPVS